METLMSLGKICQFVSNMRYCPDKVWNYTYMNEQHVYGIENPIYTVLDTCQHSKAVVPQPVN